MEKLELKTGAKFKNNEKMGIFFAVIDAYERYSSFDCPITDVEMVNILSEKYSLNVERRTIKRYRDFVSKYFAITFLNYKKGHYIKKPPPSSEEEIVSTLQKNINKYDAGDDDIQFLKVLEKGNVYEILPIEIMILGGVRYVAAYCSGNILNFKIKDLSLRKPDIYSPIKDLNVKELRDYLNYHGIYNRILIEDVLGDDRYDITADILLKKSAPYKSIEKKIKSLFGRFTYKRVKRKGFYYRRYTFDGAYSEVTEFLDKQRLEIHCIETDMLRPQYFGLDFEPSQKSKRKRSK